jgi:hypothetical protein
MNSPHFFPILIIGEIPSSVSVYLLYSSHASSTNFPFSKGAFLSSPIVHFPSANCLSVRIITTV